MKKFIIYDALVFIIIIALLLFVNIPLLNVISAFIIVLLYSYKRLGLKKSLGFYSPKSKTILFSMSIGFAVILFFLSYFVLIGAIERLTGSSLNLGPFKQTQGNPTILFTNLIIGWVIGGFMEEIIFRGFLITLFMRHINPKIGAMIGIIFSSVLFGYLHSYQGPTGQTLNTITALILGAIYVFSKRNIWLLILTHGFINTLSMLMLYYGLL